MRIKFRFLFKNISVDVPKYKFVCKIAVYNARCVFAYFCYGHKNHFGYNFVAPLRKTT